MVVFDPLRSSKTNLLYLGAGCPEGWDEFGSLCYFHVNKGKMTMGQGQDECQLLGATLPVIKSAEENDFLLNLMEENGEPWLGMEASDGDNDFKWEDETSVASNFSAWAPGEPNYSGVEENCAYMYVSGNYKGMWNNNPCEQLHHVACQKQK